MNVFPRVDTQIDLFPALIIFFILFLGIKGISQSKGIVGPIVGLDLDSRITLSPMAGANWYYLDNAGRLTGFYNQLLCRYTIPNNSIGLQTNVGFSALVVGIKTGLTYEYSFNSQKSNLSQSLLMGLDALGILSFMAGINYSYILGTQSKRINFVISANTAIVFSNYKEYRMIKTNQFNNP